MKLSEITAEDLRADHEAFVAKMAKQPKTQGDHRGAPLVDTRYTKDWREQLRNQSPFDEE